jgi:hypothetical protein
MEFFSLLAYHASFSFASNRGDSTHSSSCIPHAAITFSTSAGLELAPAHASWEYQAGQAAASSMTLVARPEVPIWAVVHWMMIMRNQSRQLAYNTINTNNKHQ